MLPVTRRSIRGHNYFFSSIVPSQDSLPEAIVRAKSASAFKQKVRQGFLKILRYMLFIVRSLLSCPCWNGKYEIYTFTDC
ncbi:hypothetical protein L596_006300 [Steinernema carpocapsae]|uniref:Uncharacterized protein n=1 Tax=Steinernema carpocapsae TaxID=34508 RepID=A0A4U8V1W4_STECR|nr:hypothetical protein L596_006300 [Steinernema carpocapsae]